MPIRIGTQGWNYDAWVGPFYQLGTRPADFLSVYARAFATVEVTTPGGLAWAYASVIDNRTGDPTIVPLTIP